MRLPWKVKKGLEPMKLNRPTATLSILMAAVLPGQFLPTSMRAEEDPAPKGKTAGEFFIVSSVDVKQKQIVLKRPTEVTELIQISDRTVYLNEEGKKIPFENLRAGDTVWVLFSGKAQGVRTARQIMEGPMTIGELRRRYLKFE